MQDIMNRAAEAVGIIIGTAIIGVLMSVGFVALIRFVEWLLLITAMTPCGAS